MANRFSDTLFQLIHSLEKAEKRHFKLYIKRSSTKEDLKIVQLFDALDKLNDYDEKALLKKLPGIEKPQLSNLKTHLYKQILASLRLLKSADSIDLQTQCKQAHWNVKGPAFIALHKLFDEINENVEEYVDLIAERIVQLGGIAEGTVGVVTGRTSLVDYPLVLSKGAEHVAALSDALAAFGRTVRVGIEEMNELEDAGSADILTEISRGVDKWLWFVEAHQQGG